MSLLYTHCAVNHPYDTPVLMAFCDFDVMSHTTERDDYWKGWTTSEFESAQRKKGSLFREHFSHPKYRYVNNRPVFYRGNADSLEYYEQRFGVSPRRVLELQREGADADIYFVATNAPQSFYKTFAAWSFSAFTEYLIYSDTWQNVMRMYRYAWEYGVSVARETGLKYWVPITTGFDARAWYDHPSRFIPTPEQFSQHVRDAGEFARRHHDATDGQLNIEAWNEYGEGSILEPMQPHMLHDGDEMLRAFKAAAA